MDAREVRGWLDYTALLAAAGAIVQAEQKGLAAGLVVGVFLVMLGRLAVIDAFTMKLPDKLTRPLLLLGLLVNAFGLLVPFEQAVLGASAGFISFWALYWGYAICTGKLGMGYGDVKLFAAIGAWLGPQALVSVAGLACAGMLVWMLARRNKGHAPFGPWLAVGAAAVLLVSERC